MRILRTKLTGRHVGVLGVLLLVIASTSPTSGEGRRAESAARVAQAAAGATAIVPFKIQVPDAFHTDQETPDTVSPLGMAATTRAYAKIIDEVNKLDLDVLRASIETP